MCMHHFSINPLLIVKQTESSTEMADFTTTDKNYNTFREILKKCLKWLLHNVSSS